MRSGPKSSRFCFPPGLRGAGVVIGTGTRRGRLRGEFKDIATRLQCPFYLRDQRLQVPLGAPVETHQIAIQIIHDPDQTSLLRQENRETAAERLDIRAMPWYQGQTAQNLHEIPQILPNFPGGNHRSEAKTAQGNPMPLFLPSSTRFQEVVV